MSAEKLLFETRFKDFDVNPKWLYTGESVHIEGHLQYRELLWWWKPLSGRDVDIYVNNKKIKSGTTMSDGYFSIYYTIESPGDYVFKAVWPGDLFYNRCESGEVKVHVAEPGETPPPTPEVPDWWWMAALGGGVVAVAVVAGVVAYNEREKLMMMLGRRK